MARKPKSSDELLADILTTLQDLLILQALATGATAASVRALLTIAFCLSSASAFAQQCLHESGETPEQVTRRRAALTATRLINTIQVNRPEAKNNVFLRHSELSGAPFASLMKDAKDPVVQQISLLPDADIVPGWRLTLDVTSAGYWFSVKDTTDPCGFAYISNNSGLIYTAQPLR